MTKTVISGTTLYCSATQFASGRDWRTASRLCRDDGKIDADQATFEANPIFLELLKRASGALELACFKGGRYTADDLNALIGTNAGATLAELVADLTMFRIYNRRPNREAKVPEDCKKAEETLERLAAGELIFPFQETADAGHLEHQLQSTRDILARRDKVRLQRRYLGMRADEEAGRQGR